MTKHAAILTPWNDERDAGGFVKPTVRDNYELIGWRETTGQPDENLIPDPNLVAIEIFCTEQVLAAIELDGTYLVIWSQDAR